MRQLLRAFGGVEQDLKVQDVFATTLYTGTGVNGHKITNGINLADGGGLVWTKRRVGGTSHNLVDTERGPSSFLPMGTGGQLLQKLIESFDNDGYTIRTLDNDALTPNGEAMVSWTFRRAPRFFDVVKYVGDGVAGKQVPHNLGVTPGMIVVKRPDAGGYDWEVYHRDLSLTTTLALNSGAAAAADQAFNYTAPTSTQFTVGDSPNANANGALYLAYLFAHDTASDGVVQCGSYTGNGSASGPTVTLGWEPQYVLIKAAGTSGNWHIFDSSRGDGFLFANSTATENTANDYIDFTSTGFNIKTSESQVNNNSGTMIYLAIRKGPM